MCLLTLYHSLQVHTATTLPMTVHAQCFLKAISLQAFILSQKKAAT